ncbi:MAG: pyrroline-5-carboxylate reductase family protein, partial [Microcoleaceae cyanobacterium]
MTEQIKFGMIGGGVMGEALLSRLVAQNIYQPQEILVSEPLESRRNFLAEQYKINVTNHNQLVASATQSAILLAIK